LAIVLLVLSRFTDSIYPFGIFWPLYCLSFLDIRILITLLVSFGHYIACPFSIYGFWLPFWYLLVIILLVLSRYMDSDYPFGIFWPLYCVSFLDIRILITLSVSFGHYIVCPFSIYGFWLPFWFFWPLYCLSFLDIQVLITPLVYFSHYIACPSSIYGFWLHLWYLFAIVLMALPRYTYAGCPFGIFWPLYCLSFLDIRILNTLLVSFDHCIACPSSIYGFWLPFWYLLVKWPKDTKGVIRIRISRKDRQYNGQTTEKNRTNNDLYY
jgi:hypothetical protein